MSTNFLPPSDAAASLSARRWQCWNCLLLILSGCLTNLGPLCAEEQEPAMLADDTVVAGATIDIWRTRMKNLNPADPGAAQYVPGMLELMRDERLPWFTRRQAALTLGRIGAPAAAAVPVLLDILEHEDSAATRLWILKSLMLFGREAEAAATLLERMARDSGEQHLLRTAALETLARIGPQQPRVIPVLTAGVRGDLPAMNEQSHNELRMTSADVLSLLGPHANAALPELIRAASAEWPLLRLSAVTTIGQIGPSADLAIPTLADVILFDTADEVRDAAAKSLGQIGPQSLNVFQQLARDADPAVRERVVLGLVTMQQPDVLLLQEFLLDTEGELRVRAARRLLAVPATTSTAFETLLAALADPNARVQRHAYEALRDQSKYWDANDDRLLNLREHQNPRTRQLVSRLIERE